MEEKYTPGPDTSAETAVPETSAPSDAQSTQSTQSGQTAAQSAAQSAQNQPSGASADAQQPETSTTVTEKSASRTSTKKTKSPVDIPDEIHGPAVTVQSPDRKKRRDEDLRRMAEDVEDPKTRSYILDRVMEQMKWYSEKSREYKKRYTYCSVASIILGALIPIVSVFANGAMVWKVLIALLGAAVTAVNAFLNLTKYKDLWISYRNTREALLRLLYYYFNNMDTFEQYKTQSEKDKRLITLCETEMALENGSWRSVLVEDKSAS